MDTTTFAYEAEQVGNPNGEHYGVIGYGWQDAREAQINLAFAGGYSVAINTIEHPTNYGLAVAAETAKRWIRQTDDEIDLRGSRAWWTRLVEIADAEQGVR